ncbi:hypothetical protein [Streptomyces chiangmaiensis]|uniref:Uncharacterized protein n=1 Tax=Streptomyces chiangmaiensis TaxID=766497 RepID=A0ABU7FNI3_9ACTN|nr:hypothetical protein [Streptomyces chiangmaiensis]MED7825292.1 hypothetical protein [Streptomyces chiangmaiensis]
MTAFESTVDSIADFLAACVKAPKAQGHQQKADQEMRSGYEPECVQKTFVRFWQSADFQWNS